MYYPNKTFYTLKWWYSSISLIRNSKWENLILELGYIVISKTCQSYPNWHESIFEDQIFWKIIFNNQFFLKTAKHKENKKESEKFTKKIFKNIFDRNSRPTAISKLPAVCAYRCERSVHGEHRRFSPVPGSCLFVSD